MIPVAGDKSRITKDNHSEHGMTSSSSWTEQKAHSTEYADYMSKYQNNHWVHFFGLLYWRPNIADHKAGLLCLTIYPKLKDSFSVNIKKKYWGSSYQVVSLVYTGLNDSSRKAALPQASRCLPPHETQSKGTGRFLNLTLLWWKQPN